jgi:DNA (cytosine-5)-methyltransferase 1
VSLFSGCGGLDLGLQKAGFEIVLATDVDDLCAESHKLNFPETNFVSGSIADLDEEHLSAVRREGQIDLVAGGPPCPPFSKSRFYRTEKPRGLDDPIGDATISGYLRVVRHLMPRAFLLENVPGLGYGVHRAALDFILSTASDLGYSCTYGKLNSADFGVPQIRERFFILGSMSSPIPLPRPTHAKPDDRNLLEQSLPLWRTAGEVLADLDTEENARDEGHYAGGKHHDLLCEIPPGDNYLYFTARRGHPEPVFEWRKRYWSFLLKLSPDLPSWTIQARRSNNMGPFHWRNRILRIEEVKRLQSFPDDWHTSGRIEEQWRQIGNAVPPPLAEALGRAIADSFRICPA